MGAQASKTAIIQVACGFRCRPQHLGHYQALSPVDQARGRKVLELFRLGNQVFVTGMVPYDIANPECTLACMNATVLLESGLVKSTEIMPIPGLNAFSESWNACLIARKRGLAKIVVVASDFYFTAYERMWRQAARRNGLQIDIVELNHGRQVSAAVWDFYLGLKAQGLSLLAAYVPVVGHRLAKGLADTMTAKRATEGFKIDGHTVIG